MTVFAKNDAIDSAYCIRNRQSRAIGALVGCSSHRNPAARAKAALHLSRVVEAMGYDRLLHSKELDRVLPVHRLLHSNELSLNYSCSFSSPLPPLPSII